MKDSIVIRGNKYGLTLYVNEESDKEKLKDGVGTINPALHAGLPLFVVIYFPVNNIFDTVFEAVFF